MKQGQNKTSVSIALLHYPVLGKNGEVIGSAVTNLDIHDIARVAKTYGVENYYIITPYEDQHTLVQEIIGHWQKGHGSTYNPARKAAFSLVHLAKNLEEVTQDMRATTGAEPILVTTSAKDQDKGIPFQEARQRIDKGEQTLLIFGTAHGLAPEITEKADYTLPAIEGRTEYNHLSVRSAVAIICDRLLGDWNQ